jgi:hypothetical protein
MILIFILLAVLTLSVGYSLFVRRRAPAQLWTWFHSFVATVLSVLLGVITAFWIYYHQQTQTDERERATIHQLLQRELSDIHEILAKSEPIQINLGKKTYRPIVGYVQPLAVEKAAQSGRLNGLDTAYMMHLAQTIRAYNIAVQFLLTVMNSNSHDPGFPDRLEFAIKNVEKMRDNNVREIERLARHLSIPLLGWDSQAQQQHQPNAE